MKKDLTNSTFIVADNYPIVNKSTEIFLKKLYKNAVTHQAKSVADIVELVTTLNSTLLVSNIYFTDGSILNVIPTLKKIQPNIKILIFSELSEDIYAIRCINTGALGYISQSNTKEDISNAITQVINGEKSLSKYLNDLYL